jgi:hypothetical protein
MGTTKKELVIDLQGKPQSLLRDRIIARALSGLYHDFDSPLETPKMELVEELRQAGYADLAQKVKDGDYDDETPTLEQIEELRRELGADVFDEMMGDKKRGKA